MDKLSYPLHLGRRVWSSLQDDVLKLNFYRLHVLYFVVLILISSLVVYAEGLKDNDPTEIGTGGAGGSRIVFIDALFMCCSAMTTTGLNTVNVGDLSGLQQAVLCGLMLVGNVVFVSSFVVLIRQHFFRRKLSDIAHESESCRHILRRINSQRRGGAATREEDGSGRPLLSGEESSADQDAEARNDHSESSLRQRRRGKCAEVIFHPINMASN